MKFLKNISFTFMGKVVAAVFYVLFDVLIARNLNIEDYGEWAFFFSLLTLCFCFCWLGVNSSVKVQLAKCKNLMQENNCIFAGLIIRFWVSCVLCSLILLLMPKVVDSLGLSVKYHYLKDMVIWGVIIIFFNSFIELIKESFIGLKNYIGLFVISSIEYFMYFLITLVIFFFVKNVFSPLYGMIIGGAFVTIIGLSLLLKYQKIDDNHPNKNVKEYFGPICRYAIPMAIIGVGSIIMVEMDTFLLGLLSTNHEVAIYSIGKNLCTKLGHINYAITIGTLPIISIDLSENNKAKIKKIKNSNMIVTMGVSVLLLMFSGIYIYILYGSKYSTAAMSIRLLIPYYALSGLSLLYAQLLDFRGRGYLRSGIYVIMVVMNLIFDIILIPRYGALGAAFATDISLVPYFFSLYYLSKKELLKS